MNHDETAAFFVIAIFVLIAGLILGGLIENSKQHRLAIEAGVGQYDSKTGNFEYIKVNK